MAREVMIRVVGDAASARKALGDTTTAAGKLGDTVQGKVRPANSTFNRLATEFRHLAPRLGRVALAAQTLFAGFSRVRQIDEARAKLTALGHDTQSTADIMDSALESVTGTAFSLADAATAASTAVAAGIEPGEELTRYLSLTADAAHVAGTQLDDMAAIINKTTTAGKVSAREMNQLAERGLPIWQWLAAQYGVTADELRKMVSRGEVDSAALLTAIETNIGGAAKSANDSWSGLVSNLGAAQARLGAAVIEPLFNLGKTVLPTAIQGVDLLTDAVSGLGGFLQGDGLPLVAAAAAMGAVGTAAKVASVSVQVLTTRAKQATVALKAKATALMSLAAAHPVLTALTVAVGALTFAWMRGRQAAQEKRQATTDLAQEMRRLGDAYAGTQALAEGLVTESDLLRRHMLDLGLSSDDLATALAGSEQEFEAFLDAIIESSKASGDHGLETEALTKGLREQRDITQDATVKAEELGEVVGDAADATGDAVEPTDDLADAWKIASDLATGAKNSLAELQREIDSYLDKVFGAVNAEAAWWESIDRLTDSVTEHGTSLDITTEAGRRNEAAIQRLIEAGKGRIDQMREDGATTAEVSAAQRQLAEDLETLMGQMGFTAKEADRYAGHLRDIPTSITTTMTLDVSQAMAAAATVRSAIEGVGSRLASGVASAIQGRASGGRVNAGEAYWVGERGPELLLMPRNGEVIPNHSQLTQDYLAGRTGGTRAVAVGGGTTVHHHWVVNAGLGVDGAKLGGQIVDAVKAYERTNGKNWRDDG